MNEPTIDGLLAKLREHHDELPESDRPGFLRALNAYVRDAILVRDNPFGRRPAPEPPKDADSGLIPAPPRLP